MNEKFVYVLIIGGAIAAIVIALVLRARSAKNEEAQAFGHSAAPPRVRESGPVSFRPPELASAKLEEELRSRLRTATTLEDFVAIYEEAPRDSDIERQATTKIAERLRALIDSAKTIAAVIEIINDSKDPCPGVMPLAIAKGLALAMSTEDAIDLYEAVESEEEDDVLVPIVEKALELTASADDFDAIDERIAAIHIEDTKVLARKEALYRPQIADATSMEKIIDIIDSVKGDVCPTLLGPATEKALSIATSCDEALDLYAALEDEDDDKILRPVAMRALELAKTADECETVSDTVSEDYVDDEALTRRRVELAETPQDCMDVILGDDNELDLDDAAVQEAVCKAADLIRAKSKS